MSGKYPNSGTLNKNDRKEKDTHPDYKGKCEIDGQRYWMDAWIKQGKDGKFMSVSFKPMQERVPTGHEDTAKTADRFKDKIRDAFGIDDNIPF